MPHHYAICTVDAGLFVQVNDDVFEMIDFFKRQMLFYAHFDLFHITGPLWQTSRIPCLLILNYLVQRKSQRRFLARNFLF